MDQLTSRRVFARYLAASPLIAALGAAACTEEKEGDENGAAEAPREHSGTLGEPDQDLGELVTTATDALDVFDMRVTAQRTLPPAHYGYIATGVDGDVTLRANRSGFAHWDIRDKRLAGIEQVDMSTSILGTPMETPIIISPTGSQQIGRAHV